MHVIRLRFPWDKSRPGFETQRIDVPEPDHSERADADAITEYRRKFNRPANLDSGNRVYLHVAGWQGTLVEIRLNEQLVQVDAEANCLSVDIADLMEPNNRLVIRLAGEAELAARLSGEVTLAIAEAE